MKKYVLGLAAAALLAGATAPAFAAHVCIDTRRIDSTTVPDARHIIFRMKDGTRWQNTLKNSCSGLKFKGFVDTPDPSFQLCENADIIRVVEFGNVCALGPFEKLPPKHAM